MTTSQGRSTSPMTGVVLSSTVLIPAITLKKAIGEFLEQNPACSDG